MEEIKIHIKIGKFIFKTDQILSIEDGGFANNYKIKLLNGFVENVQLTPDEYSEVTDGLVSKLKQ